MTPQHKHKCPACVYVWTTMCSRMTDWYVCEGSDHTVLGRQSSALSDYWSTPISMVEDGRYLVATHEAVNIVPYMMVLARAALEQYRKTNTPKRVIP